nr:TetR/AcrR family transcriptional regulator [Undibacterium oligocarboniphilum]
MNASTDHLKSRRKPVQQRSRLTQGAILDAFVRLLLEKGYARLTMRDIALVAGVGLGTLYEYFPGKKSIAAHCIHGRFKGVGQQMLEWLDGLRGEPAARLIPSLIERLIVLHAERAEEWSALIFLERQLSELDAYAQLYQYIADIWTQALLACADAARMQDKNPAVLHAVVYGLLYQTLMLSPQRLTEAAFSTEMQALVAGYLQFPVSGQSV